MSLTVLFKYTYIKLKYIKFILSRSTNTIIRKLKYYLLLQLYVYLNWKIILMLYFFFFFCLIFWYSVNTYLHRLNLKYLCFYCFINNNFLEINTLISHLRNYILFYPTRFYIKWVGRKNNLPRTFLWNIDWKECGEFPGAKNFKFLLPLFLELRLNNKNLFYRFYSIFRYM